MRKGGEVNYYLPTTNYLFGASPYMCIIHTLQKKEKENHFKTSNFRLSYCLICDKRAI